MVITARTRNAVVSNEARGFESHLLRQQAQPARNSRSSQCGEPFLYMPARKACLRIGQRHTRSPRGTHFTFVGCVFVLCPQFVLLTVWGAGFVDARAEKNRIEMEQRIQGSVWTQIARLASRSHLLLGRIVQYADRTDGPKVYFLG